MCWKELLWEMLCVGGRGICVKVVFVCQGVWLLYVRRRCKIYVGKVCMWKWSVERCGSGVYEFYVRELRFVKVT